MIRSLGRTNITWSENPGSLEMLMADIFDVARARAETIGCHDIVHFNNAGASLMPVPVADCLRKFLQLEEALGGYETAEAKHQELDNFYTACAMLLNCSPSEIAFMENATRAWDMAFYAFRFSPGDRILTTMSEYGSNVIAYNQQARRYGVKVEFVPDDENGQIDLKALERMIDSRVKLVSISLIPTGGGLINPAAEVGLITRAHGIPFLLDACQGVGQMSLDVQSIGCDLLSATGRKYLRGPRATGMLYVSGRMLEHLEPPFLDQHSATLVSATDYHMEPNARRFENWEQNFMGKAALGVAIDYALNWGLDAIRVRVEHLAERLRERLQGIVGIVLTDQGVEKCGIVTFYVRHVDADAIKDALGSRSIHVSVSGGSGMLVSFRQRSITRVVRASVHYFNTEQEIDYFIEALEEVLRSG